MGLEENKGARPSREKGGALSTTTSLDRNQSPLGSEDPQRPVQRGQEHVAVAEHMEPESPLSSPLSRETFKRIKLCN